MKKGKEGSEPAMVDMYNSYKKIRRKMMINFKSSFLA